MSSPTTGWQMLGPIVQTQIHTDRMVVDSTYHHEMITTVDSLHFSCDGLVGVKDGLAILHGHHRRHPNKTLTAKPRKFRPDRLLSIGFTSHYEAMAKYFGNVPIGIAAEDLIVEHDDLVPLDLLISGIRICSERGSLDLSDPAIAKPCAPFTRHLIEANRTDRNPKAARRFLQNGMRGFVIGSPAPGTEFVIEPGDHVLYRTS